MARKHHAQFTSGSASAVLAAHAITSTTLSPSDKERIIVGLKAIAGRNGTSTPSGEGVGNWRATGPSIQQELFFDAQGLAWIGNMHYDFTGEPHGSVPTPHVQFIRLRAAGSDTNYPIRTMTRALTLTEIQALLASPNQCPATVWQWVVANAVSGRIAAAERDNLFQ
ncbi:MAG TPA: hypothetical protein VFR24_09910 [Candidatus Angelobacter sp.]|nr:hypothetical protein [Candidatus Angelobacter sp.]